MVHTKLKKDCNCKKAQDQTVNFCRSRNAKKILKKAQENSITWQKYIIFKIFLMTTL